MQKEDWCLVVDYRNKGAAKQDIENANDIEILQKIVEPCIFRTFQFASKTKFRLIALLENEENLRKYFNIEDDCNKPKMFFIFLLSHGTENLLHHERKVGDPSSSSSQKSINEKSGNEDVYEACSRNRFIDSTLIILFQETTRVVRPEKNKKNIVKRISVDQSARNNFGYINTCIEPKSHASFYSVSWLVKAVVDTAKYMKKDTPMHILLTKVCVKTLSLCPDQTLELKFPALNRQNVFKRSAVKDDSNSPPDHTKYNDAYEVKKKFKLAINLHRMFTFPYDFDEKNEVKSKDLVESGFYLNSNTEKICCYFCDLISDVKEWRGLNFAEILDRHHKLSPDCRIMYSNSDNVSHEVSRGSIGNRNFYKYETYRLYSLIKHMEHWNYVKPSDMAAWGFYYVGPGDSVQCFSCNLILSSWEQNDSAKSEHIRWNADCPFLRSNGSYCNVVIGEENLNSDSTCDCAHGRRSHTPTPPRPVQPEFTRQCNMDHE
ncbi:uncharacterized protein LOC132202018 isoform X2 [Neocloeon triangulifer]|uniref:uncharacterized protein LOC132202018 isoform X2 n=1 Tax=Neocloeon triangulifer TaxID=2078957 RepID=UPI00286F9A77|nr:uncharacterized protein LOC132202018 isoform X2 [Neocloeon triangulifer]